MVVRMAHEKDANRAKVAGDAILRPEVARLWREALGLSLRDAAKLSGTSYSYIAQFETGARTPTDRWRRDLKHALVNAALEMRRAS